MWRIPMRWAAMPRATRSSFELCETARKGVLRYTSGISFSMATTAAATGHDTWRKALLPKRWWLTAITGTDE